MKQRMEEETKVLLAVRELSDFIDFQPIFIDFHSYHLGIKPL